MESDIRKKTEKEKAQTQRMKKGIPRCHTDESSFNSTTCRGHKPISLALKDTVCAILGNFLFPLHILCHFTSSSTPPSSRPLHPFRPCRNFISLHVISKLAPNEFLISLNSVAVVITFIVFSFTISPRRRQESAHEEKSGMVKFQETKIGSFYFISLIFPIYKSKHGIEE